MRPNALNVLERTHDGHGGNKPARLALRVPSPRSLPLDQEALRIYERAYSIGLITERDPKNPPITFSTVALALLTGQDETSGWFTQLATSLGPNTTAVCDGKETTLADVQAAGGEPGKPANVRLSNDKQLLTLSARSVLETAEEWANKVGGPTSVSAIWSRHI